MHSRSLSAMSVSFAILTATLATACGGSYTPGKTVVMSNGTIYYPKPELPNDSTTVQRLKTTAEKLGCKTTLIDIGLVCDCTGGQVVFVANQANKSVMAAACPTGFVGDVCTMHVKQIAGEE